MMTLRNSKARVSELVQLASQGEEVLITVRGRPKTRLLAVGGNDVQMEKWMRELESLRHGLKRGRPVKSSVLDELREERW